MNMRRTKRQRRHPRDPLTIPSRTLPKTTCFPSSQGALTARMKNWEPLVSGPALAMLTWNTHTTASRLHTPPSVTNHEASEAFCCVATSVASYYQILIHLSGSDFSSVQFSYFSGTKSQHQLLQTQLVEPRLTLANQTNVYRHSHI